MATEFLSDHCGGVVIFYRGTDNFAIKELHLHVMNVISFQMVTGRRRWNVIGCYIAPINASIIEVVAATIRDQPYGAKLLMSGDLNANLQEPEVTPQVEAIANELMVVGLMDMGLYFLP